MMHDYEKRDFPVSQVRRFLEPGPIVLVTSADEGERDVMTLGWQTVIEFSPSLIAMLISSANHSYRLIRSSRECVVNLPTADMVDLVVGIGNTSGAEIDKFEHFELRTGEADEVAAPLLTDCFANFECRLVEDRMVKDYDFFIFEVVKAHVATKPKYPKTLHYTGDGVFMVSGEHIDKSADFLPGML